MSDAGYVIASTERGGVAIVCVDLQGAASYAKIMELLRELEARSPTHILVDESRLTADWITPKEVREIAHAFSASVSLATARIAVIAPSPIVYGLNRMVHGFAREEVAARFNVFRERDEALEWLVPL